MSGQSSNSGSQSLRQTPDQTVGEVGVDNSTEPPSATPPVAEGSAGHDGQPLAADVHDSGTPSPGVINATNDVSQPDSANVTPSGPSSDYYTSTDSSHAGDTTYWGKIKPLLDHLPHLDNMSRHNGRHKFTGRLVCLDIPSQAAEEVTIRDKFDVGDDHNEALLLSRAQSLKETDNIPNLAMRVILVEDLCPAMIEALGSTFELDPEFFAEHLNRSGYQRADYDDPPSEVWETCDTAKSHTSVTWFRPVYQHPRLTDWTADPAALLDEPVITRGPRKGVFWTDPGYDSASRRQSERYMHSISPDCNIFRPNWHLSTRHLRQETPVSIQQDDYPEFNARLEQKPDFVLSAWEERATIHVCRQATSPIAIILLDPLPSLVDIQAPLSRKKSNGVRPVKRRMRLLPSQLLIPVVPRIFTTLPANKLGADEVLLSRFRWNRERISSTLDAMEIQIRSIETTSDDEYRPILLFALLELVQRDHSAFCRSVRLILNEISQDSLDDYLLNKQYAVWRKLITDLELNVPIVGRSAENLVSAVLESAVQGQSPVKTIIEALNKDVTHIKKKLDEALSGLRADIQFAESHRSINEAKTVTKLTELAFLFIPLSFAASLFSMSIEELQNPVPVWTFVVTALGLALLAYVIRLVLTSDFVAESSRSALEKFWARRNVRRGTTAPTLTLVGLTLQEVWRRGGSQLAAKLSFMILVSAFIVVPIAFIWISTNLDTGFHAAMTVFLLLSAIALAGLMRLDASIEALYNIQDDSDDEIVSVSAYSDV